jgi:predicted CoA-binding protein
MEELSIFLNKDYTYAIVGASNNKDKYGNKIFRTLLDNNFNAIPINPKENYIENQRAYKDIISFKGQIDVVNFVVPPQISIKILKQVEKLNIKKAWFQKGSYDSDCIDYCKKNNIDYIKDICLMQSVKNILNKFN